MEHEAERFMHTSRLASSAPPGQTAAAIETNACIENGPTCKSCDCRWSSQKGRTDVCQYRYTKETAHNTPCDADCAVSGLVLQNQAGWYVRMCCISSQLGWGKNWEWHRWEQHWSVTPEPRHDLQLRYSCLVSNTECDGNTQFQGFLWEQAANSEFRAVVTLCASYAAGPVDPVMFFTCWIGLVGFQTHQCCLLGSHGHACLSAQGQGPLVGLEPPFRKLTSQTVHVPVL